MLDNVADIALLVEQSSREDAAAAVGPMEVENRASSS
jgi:hypothetical protein